MMTLRKRRIILGLCVLVFLVIVPAALLYSNGYRLDSRLRIIKTGGMFIYSPLSGSQIFINNKLEKETNILQKGYFLQNLTPATYSVLVAKDGYWPWQKNLAVKEQFVTEARAMLLPLEPKGEIIKKENFTPLEKTKYDVIIEDLENIKKEIAATAPLARFTKDEKQRAWWNPSENEVWAEWLGDDSNLPYYFNGKKEILALNSIYPVRNVNFFPKRKDLLIVAVQNGVFALEIDERGGRIIQPIYKGKEPIFTLYENESNVYILDDDILIRIELE